MVLLPILKSKPMWAPFSFGHCVLMFRIQFLLFGLMLLMVVVPARAAETVVLLHDAVDFQTAVAQVERQNWTELDGTIPVEKKVTWVYFDLSQSNLSILYLGNPYLLSYKLISPESGEEFYLGGLLAEKESRVIFHPEYLLPLSSSWGGQAFTSNRSQTGICYSYRILNYQSS